MSAERRITLFRNGSRAQRFLVFVPDSLLELLSLASEKLSIEAGVLFSEQGAIIDDIRLIRDNDVVYVGTADESFAEVERGGEESGGIKRKSEHLETPHAVAHGIDDSEPVKLFVGSLSRTMTKEQIENTFSEYGTIVEIKMLTDKITGQSKGAAFVRLSTRSAGERAIAALNGQMLAGSTRPVTVKYAEGDPAADDVAGDFKLFVGSLPKSVTEERLREIFSQYGNPTEVIILRGTPSQTRGGAFVKYRYKREAVAAINGAHSLVLEGSPIVVRFADNKPTTQQAAFGGMPFSRMQQLSLHSVPQGVISQGLPGNHTPVCPVMHGYGVCTCGALAGVQQQQDMWKRQMVQAPSSPQRAGLVGHMLPNPPGQPVQFFGAPDMHLNQYQTYQTYQQ